jgi:CheY-like chemotaxis protein
LCLLDYQMPLKDGVEVVEEVKAFIELKNKTLGTCKIVEPLFVFLTSYKTPQLARKLARLNIKHCYEKPIMIE